MGSSIILPQYAPGQQSPDGAPPPRTSYLICAIPRTGSYLLCDILRRTGVAGQPNEYFNESFQSKWSRDWGTQTIDDYLTKVTELGTTPNGVFGAKMHSIQFDALCRQMAGQPRVTYASRPAILEKWFPSLQYVRLRRRDQLRQAISYVRAIQTSAWWDAEHAPGPSGPERPDLLCFDFQLILGTIKFLGAMDQKWTDYFDAIECTPMEFDYEEIAESPHDVAGAILGLLHLESTNVPSAESANFKRQSDGLTDEWVARFHAIQDGLPSPSTPIATHLHQRRDSTHVTEWAWTTANGAGASPRDARLPPTVRHGFRGPLPLDPTGDVRAVLAAPNWLRSTHPFPHVRAAPVFTYGFYSELAEAFRERLDADLFQRDIPGYDITNLGLTPTIAGPFSIFFSRAWHDMLAALFDVDATGEVNVSLHHHAVGSLDGKVHNDLNPGWFPAGSGEPNGDSMVSTDRAICDYQAGRTPDGSPVVERTRAVAAIFHLANPEGPPLGGDTGLYTSRTQPVDRPTVRIPPNNNAMVAFECTPLSLHSFLSNRRSERNSLVMWLHRSKKDAVEQFGKGQIVDW